MESFDQVEAVLPFQDRIEHDGGGGVDAEAGQRLGSRGNGMHIVLGAESRGHGLPDAKIIVYYEDVVAKLSRHAARSLPRRAPGLFLSDPALQVKAAMGHAMERYGTAGNTLTP